MGFGARRQKGGATCRAQAARRLKGDATCRAKTARRQNTAHVFLANAKHELGPRISNGSMMANALQGGTKILSRQNGKASIPRGKPMFSNVEATKSKMVNPICQGEISGHSPCELGIFMKPQRNDVPEGISPSLRCDFIKM